MRIAVIVCGNVRAWDECRNKEWMFSYDVFGSTYDTKYNFHPFIKSQLKPYDEVKIASSNDIQYGNLFKRFIVASSERDFEDEKTFHPAMKDIFHGYYQYKCIKRGCLAVEEYEKENGFKYDYIIKVRFDMDYSSIPNWDKDFITIPTRGGPPSDFIIAGPRDEIMKMPDFICKQYKEPISVENATHLPPHGVLNMFLCKSVPVITYDFGYIKRPTELLK